MKRKTLYIILASVWAVALITLITVCVTAFGSKDNNDGGSATPPTQQGSSGSQGGDNEDDNWSNNY